MLIYMSTGGKFEILDQISDQFDIFSKDPLLKESLRKISKGYPVRTSWNY
jgi:hypothetical protein